MIFDNILFLGALNRYFIQLISCGDDYQFQELIRVFLPVLIRSIEIQTDDFRKKVRNYNRLANINLSKR
jgi:hypothetical protein